MTIKNRLSILIPARNEPFLSKTILDLLAKAKGDIEIIVNLDGYWPIEQKREFWTTPAIIDDPRVTYIHRSIPVNMRGGINGTAALAKGEYLMKCDAHTMYDEGFDEKLKADMEDNWVVIPRRHRLDAEKWELQEVYKPAIDLHYLSCPMTNRDGYSMHGAIWPDKDRERLDVLIDDTMSFQGSLWFMKTDYFRNFLHGMSEVGYGGFCQEPQEIANKVWLTGGRVVVNKKTWYAHLHKGRTYGRMYYQNKREIIEGHVWAAHHWLNDKEPNMKYKFEWLVDKFWPVPTWPKDWRELILPFEDNSQV